MNRVIKFRAWNKADKGVCLFPMQNMNSAGEFDFDVCGSLASSYSLAGAIAAHEIVVMQYTGLKDKNGVEIYENDLVLVRDVRICEVLFHEQAACWDIELRNALSSLNIGPVSPASWQYHVEVIGNIHQDSHLLNENP